MSQRSSRRAFLKTTGAMSSRHARGAVDAARCIGAMQDAGLERPRPAGLPIVVKDNIDTAMLPATGSSAALRNVRPVRHAPSLRQLADTGAIFIGKANLHELAFEPALGALPAPRR